MEKPENQVIALRGGSVEWLRLRKGREGWERDAGGLQPLPDADALPAPPGQAPAPETKAALAAAVHAMAGRHATLAIPGACAIQRIVSLPATDPAEIAGMVDLQIDALSPFPPETVAGSFELLETGAAESRVLIAAVPKNLLEPAGDLLRQQGLRIDRITLSTLGWWTWIRRRLAANPAGRRVALIADRQNGELIVADQGAPILFRAIARPPGLEPPGFAQDLAQETAYSLTALQLEHGHAEIAGVSLWLADDAPPGLADAIQSALGRPVQVEPLDALGSLCEGLAQPAGGAAGSRLNLAPDSWRIEEKARLVKRRLAAASAAALVLWSLGVAGILAWQELQTRRLAGLETRLAALRPAAQAVRETRRRVQALTLYENAERAALECLRELVLRMPPGIELNQLTFEKGKAVTFSGQASSSQPIYDFKKALDGSPLFFGAELQGPSRSMGRETFRIALSLQEGLE